MAEKTLKHFLAVMRQDYMLSFLSVFTTSIGVARRRIPVCYGTRNFAESVSMGRFGPIKHSLLQPHKRWPAGNGSVVHFRGIHTWLLAALWFQNASDQVSKTRYCMVVRRRHLTLLAGLSSQLRNVCFIRCSQHKVWNTNSLFKRHVLRTFNFKPKGEPLTSVPYITPACLWPPSLPSPRLQLKTTTS